jgi:N-acetylneuraminate synthase
MNITGKRKKMRYKSEVFIGERRVAHDTPTYFIADIAANHDNDIERAKDLIWSAADAGADAAKFQHFEAPTIVSDYGFKSLGAKASHQSTWEKSVYEIYEDATLNINWTEALVDTCRKAQIDFFTSPYALKLVDKVDPYVPAYKIGSGDITFEDIIIHIAKKNKPVLLATGASSMDEVKRAVMTILDHNANLILMQCNTNYTGSPDNFKYINLNVINTYKELYPGMILGLSDHTPGHITVLGAIAIGARVIEKHYTDDNSRKGPDHSFSMNPQSWKEMIVRSREIEASLGSGQKAIEENEKETVILQRRALRATKDLPAGHMITAKDIIALRPAPENSFNPYQLPNVIGKKLAVQKISGDAIFYNDIE